MKHIIVGRRSPKDPDMIDLLFADALLYTSAFTKRLSMLWPSQPRQPGHDVQYTWCSRVRLRHQQSAKQSGMTKRKQRIHLETPLDCFLLHYPTWPAARKHVIAISRSILTLRAYCTIICRGIRKTSCHLDRSCSDDIGAGLQYCENLVST